MNIYDFRSFEFAIWPTIQKIYGFDNVLHDRDVQNTINVEKNDGMFN